MEKPDPRTALPTPGIVALAGLGGAAVGGYFTCQAADSAEKAEDRRQERQLDAEARGATRYLFTEFERARVVALAIRGASFPHFAAQRRAFTIRPEPDDLRLLFTRLSAKEFDAVSDGLRRAELVRLQLTEGPPVTLEGIGRREMLGSLGRAMLALKDTADLARIDVESD